MGAADAMMLGVLAGFTTSAGVQLMLMMLGVLVGFTTRVGAADARFSMALRGFQYVSGCS